MVFFVWINSAEFRKKMRFIVLYIVLVTVFTAEHLCLGCFRCEKGTRNSVLSVLGADIANKPPTPSKSCDYTSMDKITVLGKWMMDKYQRKRIFHGWNSVGKDFPYYNDEMLNMTKLEFYKSLGFNVVRLGCMWSGFEPVEGRYNVTYIELLRGVVKRLNELGIYVIMDMHQDLMSTKYGNYDGIPIWILNKFPPPPHPYPWPIPPGPRFMWSDGYLSQALGLSFQHLYDNYAGALDSMAKFWAKVAETFKDDDNVLGYELINEPWAGDIYSMPYLLEPGNAGRINLAPSYNKINNAIREYDTRTLLFYEPVTWGVYFNGNKSGTGFDEVPGGAKYKNLSVLAYHYYCWIFPYSQQHGPYPKLERFICDNITGAEVFSTISEDIRKTGGSSFLTEFGACDPDGNKNSSASIECNFVMEKADDFLASWTYWDDVFFDADDHAVQSIAEAFSRVYARAVSGEPLMMIYNATTSTFYFKYKIDASIRAPTEIIIPELHYPKGFKVNLTEGYIWIFNKKQRILEIHQAQNIIENETRIVEVKIMKI